MLCLIRPILATSAPDTATHAFWSRSMSTITRDTPAFTRYRTAPLAAFAHQTNSWPASWPAWALARRWAERRRQRRALAELAALPHLLEDVGLTRARAMREARKPFWQR